jgi:hypothetical protein
MSPVTLLSHFQKIKSIGYGSFQTYGNLHWLFFLDRSGNISHMQNFYSLPPFMHLSFQKLFYPLLCQKPSIFTDASGHGTAAHYTKDCHKFESSAQRAESYAVVMVLRDFPQQSINLYSDSPYVVGVLYCFETAYISHTSSEVLF